MTFAEPAFLLFLLLIPLIGIGAFLADQQRKSNWQKIVAARHQQRLAAPASQTARWLSLSLALLALSLTIIALAQPEQGERLAKTTVRGRNIMLALDASRSMLVRDVAPDRLNAAKAAIFELLEKFPADRIGLLAFAGSASIQAPLTVDHNALIETLNQLDTSNIPTGGSNLADAVNLATHTLKQTGQSTHALIVLSDGELHEGELGDAAYDARQAGVLVVTIGIGTDQGGFVPDPSQNDKRFRDNRGNPVLSRLNPAPLRTLAGDTGGIYIQGVGQDVSKKIETVINRLDEFEGEGGEQITAIPRYHWFLIPAVILFLASIALRSFWKPASPTILRHSTAALILTFTLLQNLPALENPLNNLLAEQALKSQDHQTASELFNTATRQVSGERLARTHFGEASALYKQKRYQDAGHAYSQALLSEDPTLRRDSHFQLANTLFHRGIATSENSPNPSPELLESALTHYDSALELDPSHQPTVENRAHVAKILEELKQQQQEQQQQQQQDQQQNNQDQDQDNQQQEQQTDSESDSESEQQKQPPQPNEDQSESGQEDSNPQNDSDQSEGEQQQQPKPTQDSQQKQNDSDQQNAQPMRPRENETPEEFARRILSENADLQKQPLRSQRLRQTQADKDW
ncbi:MAG: VWA domain-containing protein [Verrucomicrobiota bacterium]